MPALYDAHNHLQDDWLAPHLEKLAAQLTQLDLRCAVINGTCETDWPRVAALARAYPWVRPSFGLHPWNAGNRSPQWKENLVTHLDAHPSAGVGEIGLDRWMLNRARPDDPRLAGLRRAPLTEQTEVFTAQLAIATERNLAATIHCIDAWGALADILRSAPLPARGFLLHAYGGSAELVRDFTARGAYFSFNGYFLKETARPQTPPRISHLEIFKTIPFERLLVETDAPAMSLPQPWRTHKLPPSPEGEPVNHPGNIEAAYAALAALRGIDVASLSLQVEKNFHRLFG
jgi:TatD DNase family protein